MNFDDRTEQLSFSASLQYQQAPDNWKQALQVEKHQQGLHATVKYHFKMCHDLSLHLTLAEEQSPLWTTLNYLFNFALIELRLAEFKYLEYLLSLQLIGFEMQQKDLLFVLAQSLFRVRETLLTQHRQLADFKIQPHLFDIGDRPFRHHSEKVLMRVCFKSICFIATTLEKGLLIFKKSEDQMDKDFWEHMACRLGFVIHMLNRVLVLAPGLERIDE